MNIDPDDIALDPALGFADGVLPEWKLNDGWSGAAGAELRQKLYEPYPHAWDSNLDYCRVRFAMQYGWPVSSQLDRPADKIPGWILRSALPYLPRSYHQDRYYEH